MGVVFGFEIDSTGDPVVLSARHEGVVDDVIGMDDVDFFVVDGDVSRGAGVNSHPSRVSANSRARAAFLAILQSLLQPRSDTN